VAKCKLAKAGSMWASIKRTTQTPKLKSGGDKARNPHALSLQKLFQDANLKEWYKTGFYKILSNVQRNPSAKS
jgi:hypothetical protein